LPRRRGDIGNTSGNNGWAARRRRLTKVLINLLGSVLIAQPLGECAAARGFTGRSIPDDHRHRWFVSAIMGCKGVKVRERILHSRIFPILGDNLLLRDKYCGGGGRLLVSRREKSSNFLIP
jgi:hypothetical protein